MARANWLADIAADAFRGVRGYRVETYPNWQNRGYSEFYPRGIMDHHTGGGGTFDNMVRYMMEVSSIKPSCNLSTSPPENGVVRIIITASGRANHAGKGSYGNWLPSNHGNLYTIGGEHHNSGYQTWPQQQLEGIHILDAAILRHLDLGPDRVVFHKNYAGYRGKWDMHTLGIAQHRQAIQARMSFQGDGFMAGLTEKEQREVYDFIKILKDGASAFGVPPLVNGMTEIFYSLNGVDKNGIRAHVTNLINGLPAKVVAKLPPASTGGLTQGQVKDAVAEVINEELGFLKPGK